LDLLPVQGKVAGRQKKPQEPQTIVPYTVESATFDSIDDKHQLVGTLSIPKADVKTVAILLTGSGPSTRDEDVAGHKVFLVLADQLTRQGIAVLRFDDRGVGESSGNFSTATSKDFADDAIAAFMFLTAQARFKHSKIGFIGHSEGGLIGAIAAAKHSDIDFLVTLAGPGTTGGQVLIDQSYHINHLMGASPTVLKNADKVQKSIVAALEEDVTTTQLVALMKASGVPAERAIVEAEQVTSAWFRYFIKTDPKTHLSQLNIPVFALNGELDVQVIAPQNIAGIKQAVPTKWLTTKTYPGLNHLFQPATTGLPSEYSTIATTFSDQVSLDIAVWLNHFKG
jgi:pimeloyl-ACP methyl ester carboxylesterase